MGAYTLGGAHRVIRGQQSRGDEQLTRLGEPVCPCGCEATLSLLRDYVFEPIGGSVQYRACRYNSR